MKFNRTAQTLSEAAGFTFNFNAALRAKVYNRPERRLQEISDFHLVQAYEGCGRLRVILKSELSGILIPVSLAEDGPYLSVEINAGEIVETLGTGLRLMELSVLPELLTCNSRKGGYFIMPSYTGAMVELSKQEPKQIRDRVYMAQEEWEKFSLMNCFAAKTAEGSVLGIVDSGDFFAWIDAKLDGQGKSSLWTTFGIRHSYGEVLPQETKRLLLLRCGDAEYPKMALAYRDYLISRRGIHPLKERCEGNPTLAYSAEAMRVKIFHGLKKPFLPDGSAPLHSCSTFKESETIVKAMKSAGIEKATVTLVGWNTGGHDGAYPQRFPIEPEFGSENALKDLIGTCKALGYQIVPHDNVTDVYLNSPAFDYESVARDEHGLPLSAGLWSGGQSYKVCPTVYLDRYGGDFKRIKELGFEGSYYLDAQGTGLWRCHDPKHPADERQFAISLARILQYPRELFGAVSCEIGQTYTLPYVDEVAHLHGQSCFDSFKSRLNPSYASSISRIVPFYNVAVHGIVLYQGGWIHSFRGKPDGIRKALLMQLAHGARPSMEVSFRPLGNGDEYISSIKDVAPHYDISFNKLKGLHTELFESYEDNGGESFKLVYADGTAIEIDLAAGKGSIRRGASGETNL